MSQLLISVVMPTLNQARYIREAIESVLSQDYRAFELIIVDGQSTDGTLDILKSYGDRIAWTTGKDKNLAEAINKGIRVSQGDLVYSLASDEVLLPHALSTLARHAEESEAEIVVGNGLIIDEVGATIGEIEAPGLGRFLDVLTLRIKMPFACSCFRRYVCERYPFDEDFVVCTDYMFWLTVMERVRIVFIPDRIACWRRQAEAWSVRSDGAMKVFDARLKALDKYLATNPGQRIHYPTALTGAYSDLMEHYYFRHAYRESLRVFSKAFRLHPRECLKYRWMRKMAVSSATRLMLGRNRPIA